MTTNDFSYALKKAGFIDYGKNVLKNGDCKVLIINDSFSITDGITRLPILQIEYIKRIVIDTLANMLIVECGRYESSGEYSFIL